MKRPRMGFVRIYSKLLPHYGDDWWMMSMHAISLCETGQTFKSMQLMEKALNLNPRNANAAHFFAHILYEENEVSAGRDYLNAWMPNYDRRSLLHGHLKLASSTLGAA